MVGLNVADRLGVPAVAAHLQPATPTAVMPSASLPSLRRPPARLNRATWTASEWLSWRAFRPGLQAQRRRLGLSGLPRRRPSRWPLETRAPILYGFSPTVVPVPADWPPDVHVTGYWFRDLDPDWTPPPELTAFLAAGPPPVYLGFGSMPDHDPAALARILIAGARQAGLRMLVHSGWSKLRDAGTIDALDTAADVLIIDDVPHSWLFPQTVAVVHHGGAGTTAAALRAGVPAVVVPLLADQFFWAHRTTALGASPPPIPREHLTQELLSDALQRALEPARRVDATAIAQTLTTESGIDEAITILEDIATRANDTLPSS